MKKTLVLIFISILSLSLSAQMVFTELPIEGVGQFHFGMNEEEFLDGLEGYTTADTEISYILDGYSVTNMEHLGYLFDSGYFSFVDDELANIMFIKYFDKKELFPEELEELLSVIENDYGKLTNKDSILREWKQKVESKPNDENSLYIFWKSTEGGMFSLAKKYDKKKKSNSIIINVSKNLPI